MQWEWHSKVLLAVKRFQPMSQRAAPVTTGFDEIGAALSSVPTYVTRYSPDCTRRPPIVKYIAPSLG